jgi:hypothetical protein
MVGAKIMKHFVDNKTGSVFGYDSVEQADLIGGLATSLYTAITKLPTQFETWDATTKSFVNDINAEALYVSTQYQRDRAVEYAKLNQDELRFNDMMNGTTTWKDAILAIKAKYPKPL